MTTAIRLRQRRAVALRFLAGFVAVVALAACGADATSPTDTSLDGAWTARSFGVAAMLNLTWTRDSVRGTGTYNAISNTLGCGGGTLIGMGSVAFRAARSGSSVSGFMTFDNGWSPPYTGTLEDNARINGAFRSIDAGSCSFELIFGLIP
jgi:hypothetical protein